MASSFSWSGVGLSDRGLLRSSNQDAFVVDNDLGLWVIADGMGGHIAGNVASQLAVNSVLDHIRARSMTSSHGSDGNPEPGTILREAIAASSAAIVQRVTATPELTEMGTTIVAALYCAAPQPSVAIAHVGDSRAYLIREGTIQALTIDHSLVQQLVSQGHITQKQAKSHPKQNVLMRALGLRYEGSPDIQIHPLEPRDVLLLCTDGLIKMLSEDEILSTILGMGSFPQETCQELIDEANAHGGTDNTTVVLIRPRA